jgi:WS/DGAT/MGAT family acyltransferase
VERLTALDASFLRVESAEAHMHVGWLATVDLPAGSEELDVAALLAKLNARLHLVPRFRQVVTWPVGGLGGPTWTDDPGFRIEDHVAINAAARMSAGELMRRADRFFSEQLRRDEPLWRLEVIPRLSGRRAAVLGKVHHAMVDGIAAVQLGMLLFDGTADATPETPVPWAPMWASPARRAIEATRDAALEQFRAARSTAALGLSPGKGLRMAATMRRAAFGLADDVRRPAPATYLNVPIGPQRRLVGAALPMATALAIRERTDTKLNDVVLATVAGALHRLALAHGEKPVDLRVQVPVNVRADAPGAEGNDISFLFVDLPVNGHPPAERLQLVHERTTALKEAGRAGGAQQMMKLLGYLPAPVQGQAARLAAHPRMWNLTISNVPGPRVPLYIAGACVRSILPVIPIPERHALSIGALSYERRLHLSAYLDPAALPRGGRLPVMLADAFEELDVATAGAR